MVSFRVPRLSLRPSPPLVQSSTARSCSNGGTRLSTSDVHCNLLQQVRSTPAVPLSAAPEYTPSLWKARCYLKRNTSEKAILRRAISLTCPYIHPPLVGVLPQSLLSPVLRQVFWTKWNHSSHTSPLLIGGEILKDSSRLLLLTLHFQYLKTLRFLKDSFFRYLENKESTCCRTLLRNFSSLGGGDVAFGSSYALDFHNFMQISGRYFFFTQDAHTLVSLKKKK